MRASYHEGAVPRASRGGNDYDAPVLWVYVAALIVGAGTILMQLVFAGHDAGGGHDVGGAHDASHDAEHDVGAWSIFLSARFWTFALLAFGMVGALITAFGFAGTTLTLLLALASGLAAGFVAGLTFRALRRANASTSASLEEAVGQVGRVLLPCSKGKVGKVRLELKGQSVDVLATTGDDEIAIGKRVVIEEVRGGIAHVTRAPEELAP
jgi:membrane protein implicated in regulation of membrane protease activity